MMKNLSVLLLVSCLGILVGSSSERVGDGTSLEEAERQLLLLIQGEAISVKASPALCSQRQRAPHLSEKGTDWYFGEAGCTLLYPPSANALVSTATLGLKRLYDHPEVTARINTLLDELNAQAVKSQLMPARKLRIHTTAWEIGFSLERGIFHHPERSSALRPTLCKSLKLLEQTRFSNEDLRGLAANLSSLPALAETPSLDSTVAAILRRDPGFIEVFPPTDSHAEALLGRFTPRVFLTLTDEAQRPKLRQFLLHASAEELVNLPQYFDGLRGILVLYFNVVTDDNKILPTDHVAFWQEYTFKEKVSSSFQFAEAAKLVDFMTIVAERGGRFPGQEFTYKRLESGSMALRGFVDTMPGVEGRSVTTLRGNCLSCHLYRVETFNTHARRKVEFLVPLERSSSDLLQYLTLRELSPKLLGAMRSCSSAERSTPDKKVGTK
jgi:hypothetical protein